VGVQLNSPLYTLTGPAGIWRGNWRDDTGCTWTVEKEDGWSSSPPARPSQQDKTIGDGAWSGTGYYAGRVITLSGTCVAPSQLAMVMAKDAVKAAIDPHDLSVLQVAELHMTRQAQVRLSDEINLQDKGPIAFTFQVGLFAPDPRRYAANAVSLACGLPAGATVGRAYPRTYPKLYGGAGLTPSGSVVFYQTGNYKTTPGVITFYGPLLSPQVIHAQSGKSLTFNITLNYQQTLVVDLGAQSALVNSTQSVIQQIGTGSAWFMLAPGQNQLLFRGQAGVAPPGSGAVAAMQLVAAPAWS
jgi:tail protein